MASSKKKHWKSRLHEIIFESNTNAGKACDIALLISILASIGVVMADSVPVLHEKYGYVFYILEWSFTIFFTVEYVLRLVSVKSPRHYAVSFLGIIDLLSIVPTYLSIFFAGAQSLLVLRALRLFRIFRIFKLSYFLAEMKFLSIALGRAFGRSVFLCCSLLHWLSFWGQ